MKILLLSSVLPNLDHFRASQTVLASLALSFAGKHGLSVVIAVAGAEKIKSQPQGQFDFEHIDVLRSDAFRLEPEKTRKSIFDKIDLLRAATSSNPPILREQFCDQNAAVAAIRNVAPDVVLQYWDSPFDELFSTLASQNSQLYGYLARPPQAAAFSRINTYRNPLKKAYYNAIYKGAERRHISGNQHLKKASNICALDTQWYNDHGIPTQYVPNTWPDAFGSDWKQKRKKAESKRKGLHVLGNIGGLNATGNSFGIEYLCDNILPSLEGRLAGDWIINVCGRNVLPPNLAVKCDRPNIAIRGFVDDIDEEICGNHIFLLLNNAGPYTGGYTRVIYAFSSGACLIGHTNLAGSMPELVHRHNCLLGSSSEEIADLIAEAASEPLLRLDLGINARKSYETQFTPHSVTRSLMSMMGIE